MTTLFRVVTVGIILFLLGCLNDNDDTTNAGGAAGGGAGGASGTLTLAAADMPNVMPCPSQNILTDTTELDTLKQAILQGALLYLDVPFDANDPDIFRKKCGLENFWNPTDNIDENPPVNTPATIADVILFGNAGICTTGFTINSFGIDEGFPASGTYRKEFKATFMGMTWQVRLRVQVSGTSAGNTFAAEGIDVPQDITNTLVYEVNGTPTPHNDILNAAVNALTASNTNAPSVTLEIRNSAGTPVIFTAVAELICVAKL
jgi:hypothetical protein